MQKNWFANEMASAAGAAGLDPQLVEAVAWQESSCLTSAYRVEPLFWQRYMALNPAYSALNPARYSASYGLLQIMWVDARELGFLGEPEALFQPEVGLEWGCKKLANLLQWSKGDLRSALAAYNGGKGGNAPGTPLLRNGVYADQVLHRLKFLQGTPVPPTQGSPA